MPVENAEISDMFNEMAELLEIQGANTFRVRAYRNAARTLRGLPQNVSRLIDNHKDLAELPAIGDDLAHKIIDIVRTGHFAALDELKSEMPSELGDIARLPGLGPKRVKLLYDELGVRSTDDLKQVVEDGRILELEGFGEKIRDRLREALGKPMAEEKRHLLSEVEAKADALVEHLGSVKGIGDILIAGSYRRRKATVGDLDILVVADNGKAAGERLKSFEDVEEVLWSGESKTTVVLRSGLQVDLRVVPKRSFGAACLYFTGSKAHNIVLRNRAIEKGWKLNEYGVFEGERQIAGATEKDVYAQFDLPVIPPELREDAGEFDAAEAGKLPRLVTPEDMRGDLHMHTDWSDGSATLAEMVEAARARGYSYVAITDHSPHVGIVNGLDAERLRRQGDEIDKLNDDLDGLTVLKGAEVDILEDGSLDLPDDALEALDIAVASIHTQHDLARDKQTDRLLRAIDNPLVSIIGHPTGRLINAREPYAVDMDKVIERAAKAGCVLEINAAPKRLDLDEVHARAARDAGVKLAISTDAHATHALEWMRYGVDQARRGWIEAGDVINTRALKDLRRLLRR